MEVEKSLSPGKEVHDGHSVILSQHTEDTHHNEAICPYASADEKAEIWYSSARSS